MCRLLKLLYEGSEIELKYNNTLSFNDFDSFIRKRFHIPSDDVIKFIDKNGDGM